MAKKQVNYYRLFAYIFSFLITATLYIQLGRDFLFDWDEGIYAQLGVEMISDKNILVPKWNEDVWFEKPPAIAWISATTISIFGENSLGARAAMPLFALITLISTYEIARHFNKNATGIFGIIILSTVGLFLSRSRGLNTDGALLAMIALSTLSALKGKNALTTSIPISLSIFIKGPAGLFSIIVQLPLYKNNFKKLIKVLLYTIIITLPWHVYSYLIYEDKFIDPYLFEQVIQRARFPIEYHVGNRWFYLKYLYESINPLILFLLLISILHTIFNKKLFKKINLNSLALWWFFSILAIITLMKTKLVWYSLPLMLPISILSADIIAKIFALIKNQYFSIFIVLLFSLNSFKTVLSSVEYNKTKIGTPPRIQAARFANTIPDHDELNILVPEIERVFYQIMPENQRLSSSFRYGGMPNIIFYLDKKPVFYYNEWDFLEFWKSADKHPLALLSISDKKRIQPFTNIIYENEEFLVIERTDEYIIYLEELRQQAERLKKLN